MLCAIAGGAGMLALDLKMALRSLRRAPGATAAAVISLGLGIAVCTAVFSVIEAFLIEPLPFAAQERLVYASETAGTERSPNAVSGPDLADWRAGGKSFPGVGGYHTTARTPTGHGAAERVDAAAVDSGIFGALRIAPERGRTFDPADDAPG